MPLIADRVELARRSANDTVVCRLPSGWVVLGDVQFLPGYCLLLADPVFASLNDLDDARRAEFLNDMARIGDALLQVTQAGTDQLRDPGQLRTRAARPRLPALRD